MVRCAIVPPVPVPYREPLFERLAARPDLSVRVLYLAPSQRSWDQASGWFPTRHAYDAIHLRSRHIEREGRSPVTWPHGLERALSSFAPEVVVVSEFGPATLRALAWCRARRRAIVVLSEVTAAGEKALGATQLRVHRFIARRVDGFIAVSDAARTRLLSLGVDPRAVSVSLQPVDEDRLSNACRTRDASPEGPVEVLTVARLVADKDVRSLIDGFAAAGLGEHEATLSVVGSGPLEAELRLRAQALRVPVRFFGAMPASDLAARYASASVFALTSRYEPFGVALREAVVAGLPVLCSTAVGAAREFARDGANAILFAPGEVEEIGRALHRLCTDDELRRAMGAESRKLAASTPLERDVEAFATAVSRAAKAARARRRALRSPLARMR